MAKEETAQVKIGTYISALLRKYFGKSPTSVYVTIRGSFITIYVRGFRPPMDRLQAKQHNGRAVLKTREIIMAELKPDIIQALTETAAAEVAELYADWNLEKETGLLLGVLAEETGRSAFSERKEVDEAAFREKLRQASERAEKVPGQTGIYWLSSRTIVVKRTEMLTRIEKELIKNGFIEELKWVKRPLEKHVLREVQLENVLHRRISEIFLDWNFGADLSYTVFVLEPEKRAG